MSRDSVTGTRREARHRRSTVQVVVLLMLYVGSYAILSASGQYRWRPSGELRYQGGMALFELSVWQPAGMYWERRRSVSGKYLIDANPLGWFYLPLLAADRRWIHRTGSIDDMSPELPPDSE